LRLDVALIARHPGLSRRKAREVIEKGQVAVDGETVREAGRIVAASAAVSWDPHKKALPRARLSLPLLYEDASLLIVEKPAGLLTVPSAPGRDDEDTALRRVSDYVQRLTPRHPYVGVVHRLDRDTSGALAFALSDAAKQALRQLFREHRIERRYSAIVAGEPAADSGVVELPIRDAYEGGKRGIARPGEPALPALTRWVVAERFRGAALLDVELGTGRQHQIRAHLAHIGLPILGDERYGQGAPARVRVARQMLHARVLGFVQPLSGASVRVVSGPPGDFEKALRALRGGAASRSRAGAPERRPRRS
jgi:23S rRNA pseudouridine1911/1915/1917 synthase